jgi:nucleotide-binding universal stress UspA family protein
MNEDSKRDHITRILVALDASPNSFAALRTAIDLAQRLQAEVLGIFIEDINLHRLGNLPFAQEIGHYTARSRQINSHHIRLQFRAQSRRSRNMLEKLAREAHVRWSYRVLRGSTADLKDVAEEADLIVLGRTGWSGRRRLGSTVQFMVSQYPSRTLIIGARSGTRNHILVVYDGSDSSRRALESAADMTKNSDGFLTVGITAKSSEQARHLQSEVFQWLVSQGIEPRFRWIIGWSPEKIKYLARSEECLLILPRSIEPLQEKSVLELLNEVECPVLLIN